MENKEYMTDSDRIGIYKAAKEDIEIWLGLKHPLKVAGITASLETLDDLLRRDSMRELDGFSRKIKFRRILSGSGKVITIPYVVEEHLAHDAFEPKHMAEFGVILNAADDNDITTSPGSGEGETGDVIGETPLPLDGTGEDGDSGDGDDPGGSNGGEGSVDHALEEGAYEIGKRLTQQLMLPNLTEKRKKFPTDEYTYDLTDRHRGSGQKLDSKETLKRIARTNLLLGRIDKDDLDTTKMIVGPHDRVYRVLSKERIWKSQAIVCFLRDYSGSMRGEPTTALVAQHLMIYSWLLVQYEKRVIPRFFVHDTQCREVTANQYFRNSSGGGTLIASGYKKINDTVESEGLADEYDIFVFQGSDGDDGDFRGQSAIPELEKILSYASRVGVTLFESPYHEATGVKTTFEQYVEESGILEQKALFRMHVMPSRDVSEEMNVEAIKALIAQD